MDLALTATYFPHCNLTFAIAFGCSLLVEEDIIRRLSLAMPEAAHPLLMSGIFVEIERARHIQLVEATVDELERKIVELDFQSSKMEEIQSSEAETRNQEKRTAWLDTTYLRNTLFNWNIQLAKISHHADELKNTIFKPAEPEEFTSQRWTKVEDISSRSFEKIDKFESIEKDTESSGTVDNVTYDIDVEEANFHGKYSPEMAHLQRLRKSRQQNSQEQYEDSMVQPYPEAIKGHMRHVGDKINDRIRSIIEEYDDKIRDCTMRVDGMAMATQWVSPLVNLNTAKD